MSLFVVTEQTLLLTVVMAVGYGLTKAGFFSADNREFLTWMQLNVFIPCNMIAAANNDIGDSSLLTVVATVLVSSVLLILFTLIADGAGMLLHQDKDHIIAMSRCAAHPNNGFMGLAVANAVFGGSGSIWCALTFIPTNLYVSFGEVQGMSREKLGGGTKDVLKRLFNPMNVSTILMVVLVFNRLRVPDFLYKLCSSFGACTTPLAMLICGCILAGQPLTGGLKNPLVYVTVALRNLIFPLMTAGLFALIGWRGSMFLCISMMYGCSVASTAVITAGRYDRAPAFASQCLLVSSLALPVTLPLMTLLCSRMLGVAM